VLTCPLIGRDGMRRREFTAGLVGSAWVLTWLPIGVAFAAQDTPALAFLGFQMINTSVEPIKQEEQHRLEMLNSLFLEQVDGSHLFKVVPLPPDVRQQIANGPAIANCNGCQRDYGRRAGADLVAWGTVQKVSNLILNINLYMEDVHREKLIFGKSVDIRGNTDESWRRGLDYMLRNYLLQQP
jgi:hypothetical protein